MLLINPNYFLFNVLQCLVFGFQLYAAVLYDSAFTLDCLAEPWRALYDGGMVVNSDFNRSLEGWTSFGNAKIEHRISKNNNIYGVVSERKDLYHSIAQRVYLTGGYTYAVSAWVQVVNGKADVSVIFKTNRSYINAGSAEAKTGCWTMLKGGFSVQTSGPAHLYLETNSSLNDLFVDSISVKGFSHKEWTIQQQVSVQKVRKSKVKIQAVDKQGSPIPNARVSLKQTRPHFPVGCAINGNILHNSSYRKWFLKRFKQRYTVFENELKWYYTESSQGKVDYSTADDLVGFAKSNGISIRGHNVFWNDKKYQPQWIYGLSLADSSKAATKRIKSVMNKFKGKFIHWDVVNENIHFNFWEEQLGNPNASSNFYKLAHQIDPRTTPFLNDYNTIEDSRDCEVTPEKYLERINRLAQQGCGPLGIGLEAHFRYKRPNLAYIRSSLDKLASARYKIWVTELDVEKGKHQHSYLGHILRELHSHKAVQGIMIWSAWSEDGCYRMCLTDNNFNNLKTGREVDKFLKRLASRSDSSLTDSNGFFKASLHHGEYELTITNTDDYGQQFSKSRRINVMPNQEETTTRVHRFTINVEN